MNISETATVAPDKVRLRMPSISLPAQARTAILFEMCIRDSIYGVQSLYFLNDTLLARTKLKPPAFPNAAQPSPAKPAVPSQLTLDITAIAHAAVRDQAIEEQIRGNT